MHTCEWAFPLRCACISVPLCKKRQDLDQEGQLILVTNKQWGWESHKGALLRGVGGGQDGRVIPHYISSWGRLYERPVDCLFNGVLRACKMIDSPALPGAHVSRSNVVYSTRHCPKKHTMSTAVVATLLRWLNKNTGSGGSRLVCWLGTLNSALVRLVLFLGMNAASEMS